MSLDKTQMLTFSTEGDEFSEPEWTDQAQLALSVEGPVRVRLTGARPLTFSTIGDEYSSDE